MSKRTIVIKEVCDVNSETIGSVSQLEEIHYLDTGNITRNCIDNIQILNRNVTSFPSRAQRKVRDKTIIYSTVRPIQEHFGFLSNPVDNFIVSTGFLTIDVKDQNIDPKYIYYAITQKNITAYLQTMAVNNVSSYPSINPDDVGNLKFDIPKEKKQQQKISAVLSAIDEKIELNHRINSELESMAKTIYAYWFVQFNFPDKNGKPYKSSGGKMVWNTELKREIPEGWEVKSLGDITNIGNEQLNPMDTPSQEFKHYSIPAFDESGTYKIENGEEIKSNKFIVNSADVLVSKLNPWFSRVVYSTDESDTICSTEFVVWRTTNISIKNYLYMIARDTSFRAYCTQSASGTSNSHKRVTPTVMMKYRIVYDDKIAKQFGNTLGASIKTYAKNHIENKTLTELRDWLLPMLMNGQVRPN
jgi:type I restriction enzyme S subunit